MRPRLRATVQEGTRSVYQQDGHPLGAWQKPASCLTENHSPHPPSSVVCESLPLPASGVGWHLLFWGKCPLESKRNDMKGAGSENLWQFGLELFTLETHMTMVQTEPGRPQHASQNTATPGECREALHGEALSLSSY